VEKVRERKIAWVDNEVCFTEKYRDWIREEAREEVKFFLYQRADEALEKIPQKKPDLIVVNPYCLEQGKNYPTPASEIPWDDNAVGFDLVSRIQQVAPVVLISRNGLKRDYGEKYLLDKGVSEVVNPEEIPARKFYEILEKYFRKK